MLPIPNDSSGHDGQSQEDDDRDLESPANDSIVRGHSLLGAGEGALRLRSMIASHGFR